MNDRFALAARALRGALFLLGTSSLILAALAPAHAQLRAASPAEKAADDAAFAPVEQALARLTDIESVAVVLRGRLAYEYYRDGERDRLRDVQSVQKSALSALVGVALREGHLASLEQRVADLAPDWAPLNGDPRARDITVRHLLTMTAGFDIRDAAGTAATLPPAQAWARPLAAPPGERFAYDNSTIPLLAAVIEKATGMTVPDYARRHLIEPMDLAEPSYQGRLRLRTLDMARLGQLFLGDGAWSGRPLLPADYVAAATRTQNAGGPPVGMPYGYFWWIVPGPGVRQTFMASGYGGQMIWVHPPLGMVVAVTSTVSPDSQRRGHAVQLLRSGLVAAAARRDAEGAR